MIISLLNNLMNRHDDLKTISEVDLFNDIYITIPFSFSSDFCDIFTNKNEDYIDCLIDCICMEGANHKFDEQDLYAKHVLELTKNIIKLLEEL